MQKNILIIDDEPLVTKSLERLLRANGYNPIVTYTAKEALIKIEDTNFDLIISDVRMPDTNGIDAIKEIREKIKKNNKKAVPEIFITGYADEDNYKEAVELKAAAYIYKPFDIYELLDVIRRNFQ